MATRAKNMKSSLAAVTSVMILVLTGALSRAVADGEAVPKAGQPVVVLDALSVWRIHETLKPPVIQFDDAVKPITTCCEWLDRETASAPADWTSSDSVDGTWLRGGARASSRTPYMADLCLRARFEVTDPASVKDLKLDLAYYGGVIVYINGQEIARGHLPKDVRRPVALADGYPAGAFFNDDPKEMPALRERKLADVAIPAMALRQGVNVLAIEVIRSPYHKIVDEKKVVDENKGRPKNSVELHFQDRNCPYDLTWGTCEIRDIRLTAGSADGLVPNISRPKDLQAWNSDFLAADYDADFGDRCEALRPVVIRGARNGVYSGKIVLGSPKAIEGLKVTCGDFKQDGATIAATAVRVRYATSFGTQRGNREAQPSGRYAYSPPFGRQADNRDALPSDAALLDSLLEAPSASFPADRYGAVVPVWFTVKVPKAAKPGVYTAQATVEIKGEKELTVPLSLEVADFVVPDPADYRTWMDLLESPDTLAVEYNVPLWSEKHWQMVGEAMRYVGEIGAKAIYVPLIAQTNSGNEQSMVRWIKKADGTYDYDFSIMDKYLDLSLKSMTKPTFVVFTAWEIYLDTPKQEVKVDEKDSDYVRMEKSWLAARWNLRDKGPAVTALDPSTGQIATANLPRFEDPAAKAAWKPLFVALHKRMAARGLERNMLLGMASDRWPEKEQMTVLQEVSGDLPWVDMGHGVREVVGHKLNGMATVAYAAYVWENEYAGDPDKGRTYGWKRPELYAEFRRGDALDFLPGAAALLFPELEITGQQRGLGRIGADFWPAIKDKQGERRGYVWEKYPQSMWHSCNLSSHLLVPGPTSPVASTRYEEMREGLQECEARITIEQVLTDDVLRKKLGPDLASRAQQLLDDRIWQMQKACSNMQLTGLGYGTYATASHRWYYAYGGSAGHYWYLSSNWQDNAAKLYTLAGEVARKMSNAQ